MSNSGKISVIQKDYSKNGVQTMQSSLSQKGITRVPGTGVYKFPYREFDGKYRTGLDPDASYIQRISDKTARDYEVKRVKNLKEKLEKALSLDLGPRSSFWNSSLANGPDDTSHVQPVKLMDGDNFFDLNSPYQELTFAWLRVHPTIATSMSAYRNGEFPADTQFYVSDEDIENEVMFAKKDRVNTAVLKFSNMTPEKRKKVARLLGLPISDNTKDSVVYNQVDTILKKEEFETGHFKGLSSIEVFNRFATLNDDILDVKDLVKQAIDHRVYREKPNGHIFEGDYEVAESQDKLVSDLLDDANQDTLLVLKEKLKAKKLASI